MASVKIFEGVNTPIGLKNQKSVAKIIYDPYMDSGTTCIVAKELNRKYIGCDINSNAIKITEKRLQSDYMIKIINKQK